MGNFCSVEKDFYSLSMVEKHFHSLLGFSKMEEHLWGMWPSASEVEDWFHSCGFLPLGMWLDFC